MSTRTISALPNDLVNLVFQLGNRKLVLLEGDDDVEILEEWFRDDLSELFFYAAEGYPNVESYLNILLNYSTKKRIFGILDRDFKSEQEVNNSYTDNDSQLFILRRYAIENYLLEPLAVWEELRVYHGRDFTIDNAQTMEQKLMNICRQLKTIMAANWIIHESSTGTEYFSKGHQICNRDIIIRQASIRLGYDRNLTEQKIKEKEIIIESALNTISEAYTVINGKHILHQVFEKYINAVKRGLRKEHFRNLLARTVKEKIGLHSDILLIIRQRILSR